MARTADVISLAERRTRQSAARRSEVYQEAMRRHPSYVAKLVSGEFSDSR